MSEASPETVALRRDVIALLEEHSELTTREIADRLPQYAPPPRCGHEDCDRPAHQDRWRPWPGQPPWIAKQLLDSMHRAALVERSPMNAHRPTSWWLSPGDT